VHLLVGAAVRAHREHVDDQLLEKLDNLVRVRVRIRVRVRVRVRVWVTVRVRVRLRLRVRVRVRLEKLDDRRVAEIVAPLAQRQRQ